MFYNTHTDNIPKDNPVLNIEEVALPVVGFEEYYEVSSLGRVSNYRKIMTAYVINSGYEVIDFRINNNRHKRLVHRIVAEAFIPNPECKKEVNHKDGNKRNNAVDNLEWVTSSENKQHAINTGLREYNNPTVGKKLGKHSKFFNVTYDKARNKWHASVRANNKTHYQKRFDNEIDAAKHVNWILDTLGLNDRPRNIFS